MTHDDTAFPAPPVILTADAVYDLLMGQIEPELVSSVVDTLKAKYAGESPEQATARAARYSKAFAAYDKRLAQYITDLHRVIHQYARTAAKSLEVTGRTIDNAILQTLDTAMQS